MDFGLRGDYEKLYEWLDRIGARECGVSVATFSSKKSRAQVARILVRLAKRSVRLYLIDKGGGGFIVGKRREAPWAGYYLEPAPDLEEDV
jgi:hypothetical protein